jgi:hypothetical protein
VRRCTRRQEVGKRRWGGSWRQAKPGHPLGLPPLLLSACERPSSLVKLIPAPEPQRGLLSQAAPQVRPQSVNVGGVAGHDS